MKKTYYTLLRENQDLRKYIEKDAATIKHLKKLIDITQQEYRSYVEKAEKHTRKELLARLKGNV